MRATPRIVADLRPGPGPVNARELEVAVAVVVAAPPALVAGAGSQRKPSFSTQMIGPSWPSTV